MLEALRLYVRATKLQPENWRTWYELGSFEAGLKSNGWAELHLARARPVSVRACGARSEGAAEAAQEGQLISYGSSARALTAISVNPVFTIRTG